MVASTQAREGKTGGPLAGLIVIDASTVMPGAIAGMLLADHGAEVIKVEPPGGAFFAGDPTRKSWDRGKRSVRLDLDDEAGRETLRALIATADIFVHSLDAADARAKRLDRAALADANPGLVECALSAYGRDTPLSRRPYGESLAAARLGMMATLGSARREGPVYLGHPALHYAMALVATIGMLAALRERRETGAGQRIDTSLLDAAAALSVMHWWQESGQSFMAGSDRNSPLRFGRTRIISAMVEAQDGGRLYLNTTGGNGFKRTMDLLGLGDRARAIAGLEFAVPLDDDEYQAARFDIYDAFKQRPRDEWIALLHAAEVAALPVLPPAKVLLDEQLVATGQVVQLADPAFGTIKQAGPAFRFARNAPDSPAPAPAVGQDDPSLAALLGGERRDTPASGAPLAAPLAGVRIIDIGVFFACSFGARLLADLGAEVVKVETLAGDQMRPLPDLYDGANRGKRNIAIDLKMPEGREILGKLIGRADIVLHNMRPGNAEKLGFGAEAMLRDNPALIYAYMPGYGSSGPKARLKSFAPLLSCWTGVMDEGAGEGNPPMTAALGNEDLYNGLLGAVGMLMALEARDRTGEGDYFECPQLHSSLFTTATHFLDANDDSVYGLRLDVDQCGFGALDRLYRCSDGWICIACRDDTAFAALARAIGQPALAEDPRFAGAATRGAHDAALLGLLAPHFAALTAAAAFAALDAAGAPVEIAAETNGMAALLHERWAQDAGRVFEDKVSLAGHIKVIGNIVQLERGGGRNGPAAALGEDSAAILAELGYSPDEIGKLRERRVVKGR